MVKTNHSYQLLGYTAGSRIQYVLYRIVPKYGTGYGYCEYQNLPENDGSVSGVWHLASGTWHLASGIVSLVVHQYSSGTDFNERFQRNNFLPNPRVDGETDGDTS